MFSTGFSYNAAYHFYVEAELHGTILENEIFGLVWLNSTLVDGLTATILYTSMTAEVVTA